MKSGQRTACPQIRSVPTVDKLTVWDTQNGVRKDTLAPAIPRIVLCRVNGQLIAGIRCPADQNQYFPCRAFRSPERATSNSCGQSE